MNRLGRGARMIIGNTITGNHTIYDSMAGDNGEPRANELHLR